MSTTVTPGATSTTTTADSGSSAVAARDPVVLRRAAPCLTQRATAPSPGRIRSVVDCPVSDRPSSSGSCARSALAVWSRAFGAPAGRAGCEEPSAAAGRDYRRGASKLQGRPVFLHRPGSGGYPPLGNRPLVVIGAGKRERPPGLSDSTWPAMRRERDDQVRDLARLSTNSRFVLDTASTHGIPTENPTLVAREILDVVDAIVARKALRP